MFFCRVQLSFTAIVIFAIIARTPWAIAADCPLPRTGCEVDYLAAVDDLVTEYLCERFIPGATMAIMKDGVIVYERGFGFADEHLTQLIEPDAMMRVASVSKPITAAAIRVLIDDGLLDLNTHAFDLGQPSGGVLPLEPFPTLGDPWRPSARRHNHQRSAGTYRRMGSGHRWRSDLSRDHHRRRDGR